MRRFITLFLALALLFSLAACGGSGSTGGQTGAGTSTADPDPSDGATTPSSPDPSEDPSDDPSDDPSEDPSDDPSEDPSEDPSDEPTVEPSDEPTAEPVSDYAIYDPKVMPEGGERDGVKYVAYNGIVEHIFFHPVIAYPEQAFDGDSQSNGFDDWMVTVGEYNKILESIHANGYVLVDIEDCWSEQVKEDGTIRMVKNTLYLPEGKKPLIISYDDVNYNYYMLGNGFTYKLILGEDGEIWSWGLDPQGNEVISQDLDAITILDKFVEEHPDFSPFGAKGCLSITGYEGIMGYRTHVDKNVEWTAEREANRQSEIEKVKPIIAELKRTGWTFGSHTYSHHNLQNVSTNRAISDMERWFDEVGSLVGEVSVLFYPFGGRLDGGDVYQTGEALTWMVEHGFRIFCSVGINSFSRIKPDICAVVCDRLHPDGTTLRSSKLDRYIQFYDARDIIDLEVRPDREVYWTPKDAPADTAADTAS